MQVYQIVQWNKNAIATEQTLYIDSFWYINITMPVCERNHKFNLSGLLRIRGGFRRGVSVLLPESFMHSLDLSGGHGITDANVISAVMSTGVVLAAWSLDNPTVWSPCLLSVLLDVHFVRQRFSSWMDSSVCSLVSVTLVIASVCGVSKSGFMMSKWARIFRPYSSIESDSFVVLWGIILYLQRNEWSFLLMHAAISWCRFDLILKRLNKPLGLPIRPRMERWGDNMSERFRFHEFAEFLWPKLRVVIGHYFNRYPMTNNIRKVLIASLLAVPYFQRSIAILNTHLQQRETWRSGIVRRNPYVNDAMHFAGNLTGEPVQR